MHDEARARLIEEAVASEGLDAVIAGAPPNVLMLTGYWPVTGTSVAVYARNGGCRVIVPADEKRPASSDRLERGMVFNVEPAVYIEGFGGIRHCDVVAVTEHGAEVLTPFHASIPELELATEQMSTPKKIR